MLYVQVKVQWRHESRTWHPAIVTWTGKLAYRIGGATPTFLQIGRVRVRLFAVVDIVLESKWSSALFLTLHWRREPSRSTEPRLSQNRGEYVSKYQLGFADASVYGCLWACLDGCLLSKLLEVASCVVIIPWNQHLCGEMGWNGQGRCLPSTLARYTPCWVAS